jgi:transcription-repair coupling factor (superfamily II helicase)
VSLHNIVPLIQQDPWHRELQLAVSRLGAGRALQVEALPPAARFATIAALLANTDHPVLVVTSRQDTAEEATAALCEYLPSSRTPVLWPVPESLPYEQLPSGRVTTARRVELLSQLTQADGAPIVVAPARALTQLMSPPEALRTQGRRLQVGQQFDQGRFLSTMIDAGYEFAPLVEEPGQISHRGGIIDIFPPSREGAIRIELFGDEIDSLRLVDPQTQRSVSD